MFDGVKRVVSCELRVVMVRVTRWFPSLTKTIDKSAKGGSVDETQQDMQMELVQSCIKHQYWLVENRRIKIKWKRSQIKNQKI
jgi:hypothetical protein